MTGSGRGRSLLEAASSTGLGRAALAGVARAARATLEGAERLPAEGGVLLVGNHALLGADTPPLAALLSLETGRVPRFLAERSLFSLPIVGGALRAIGAVPGDRAAAVAMLRAGEVVLVYPGGTNDSFKPSSEAYRLQWGERAGFARVAIEAGAPIVPVASLGPDEIFRVSRREKRLGRRLFGSPQYDLPVVTGVGRPPPFRYRLLPAVNTEALAGEGLEARVERVRGETRRRLEGELEEYRRVRGSSG